MKKYVAQPMLPEHARYKRAKDMVEKKVWHGSKRNETTLSVRLPSILSLAPFSPIPEGAGGPEREAFQGMLMRLIPRFFDFFGC